MNFNTSMALAGQSDRFSGYPTPSPQADSSAGRLAMYSNAPSFGKRTSGRVMKANTPTSSPHSVQRRRTTASHSGRSGSKPAHEGLAALRDQRLRHYYNSRYSMPIIRPQSWQPGFENCQSNPTGTDPGLYDMGVYPTVTDVQQPVHVYTAVSSVRQSIGQAFSMAYGYSVNAPSSVDPVTQSLAAQYIGDYNGYSSISQDTPYYGPQVSSMYTGNETISSDLNTSQMYQELEQSEVAEDVIQYPNHQHGQSSNEMSYPGLAGTLSEMPSRRRNSKELVGIGLYNDKEPSFLSSLNADSNRESLGKGLKLEASWNPPAKDESEDANDDCSSEEAEEIDDELDSPATVAPDYSSNFLTNLGDLSNHSFFFSDDEPNPNDDQYANYLTLAQDFGDQHGKLPDTITTSANVMMF